MRVVRRTADPDDARVARVELTEKGDKLVTELTAAHLAKLYEHWEEAVEMN